MTFGERHPLAFLQVIVPNAFQIGHVEKHVFACSGVDESETLVRQSLNRTFSHETNPIQETGADVLPQTIGGIQPRQNAELCQEEPMLFAEAFSC